MGVCYTSQALLSSAKWRAASDHQLVQMQNLRDRDGEREKGIFIKAYAWKRLNTMADCCGTNG